MSEITMCIIDDVKTVIDGIVSKIPWGSMESKLWVRLLMARMACSSLKRSIRILC